MPIPSAAPRKGSVRSYVRLYLIVAAPLLLAFCFLSAPFQVADEPAHFYRAIQLSHGSVMPQLAPDGAGAGAPIETGAVKLATDFKDPNVGYDVNRRLKALPPHQALDRLRDAAGPPAFTKFNNTVIYFPLAHAVAAPAIAVARGLGLSPLGWLYAGRLANALAALVISALAIGLFRERGLAPLVICLLPMALFEEASLAADALLIPFSLVLAALVSRIAIRAPLSAGLNALLFLSLAVVCVGKFAYIPLAALPPAIALLERRKASDVVQLSAIGLAVVLIWLAWTFAVRRDVFTINLYAHVSVPEQVAFLLYHPMAAGKIILQSMLKDALTMFKELVGSKLGWLDVLLPRPLVAALMALLLAALVVSRPLAALRLPTRAFSLVILAGCAAAVYVLIYLQNTGVGAAKVDGVQGRYFLPLVGFIPLVWPGIGGLQGLRARGELVVAGLTAAGAIGALVFVTMFYWRL